MGPPEPLLTVAEVAAWTRLSVRSVYALFERGELPGLKLSSRVVFNREVIDQWLAERERGTQ